MLNNKDDNIFAFKVGGGGGERGRMSYVRNIATLHVSDIKKWIEEISYYTDLR
jgi:hypothetical protein